MTKEQFATVAAAMQTYYPKENLFPTERHMTLWYQELKGLKYEYVQEGLRQWVRKEKWSPTIADLIKAAGDAKLESEVSIIIERPRLGVTQDECKAISGTG